MSEDKNGIGALLAMTPEEEKFFDDKGETEIAEEIEAKTEDQADEGEAPEVTAEEEPEPTQSPEPERVKMVPHQALHAEREERKKLAAQLEEVNRKLAEITKPKEAQEDVPNFEDDPAGYLKWQNQQALDKVAQLQAERQAENEQRQQAERHNQLVAAYKQAVAPEWQKPEFQEGYRYLVNGRIEEYKAFGYDEATAGQLALRDEMEIAAKAFEDGVNPAKRLMDIAKARGFNPSKPAMPPKMEAPKKTLDRPSMAKSGAPARKGEITPEELAEMSPAEFAKATAGGKWREFFEG